jgi:putative OPT family oligopeptide transporter
MAPVLNLLSAAYGIGAPTPEHPHPLSAPQATLMASVAKGLFGGELPWDMIAIGGVIGAVIIAFDAWLKARGSHFRMPVLAAAIGIYLPLELMVPIFLGGFITYLVEKKLGVNPHDEAERDRIHRPGTLFSAGLITGEALMGIIIAIPIVASGSATVLSLPDSLLPGETVKLVLGVLILTWVGWLMFRTAVKSKLD